MSQLSTRHPDADIRWIGGRRGLEGEIVPKAGHRLDRLWLRSLRTVDVSLSTLTDPIRLAASVPQAAAMLLHWRPDVIYSTGGYVAIPVLMAAAILRIPALLWEGNALPGRSVRATARLARARSVSHAETRTRLPEPAYLTGTPVRDLHGLDQLAARVRLGLAPDVPVLLVFGGSQAVRRLNDAVAAALPDLVTRCTVIHLTGGSAFAAAEALRGTLPEAQRERYRPYAFLDEDMDAALAAADLLVGRAGASSLAEAAGVGLPMIVVPYPHAAAHQRANAAEAVEAGAAILIDDAELDGDTLRMAADLLSEDRLARMAAAARDVGRPGATAATVALIEAMGGREALPEPAAIEAIAKGAE